MVPVSTRPVGEEDALGNQISAMVVGLATDIDDPVERLLSISAGADVAKEHEQLHRGRLIGEVAQLAVPAMATRLARAITTTTKFSIVCARRPT